MSSCTKNPSYSLLSPVTHVFVFVENMEGEREKVMLREKLSGPKSALASAGSQRESCPSLCRTRSALRHGTQMSRG